MKLEGKQKLVRIYVDEHDKWRGQPLYEAIVERAWKLGLAGATAIRGMIGFGCKSHVQAAGDYDATAHRPVTVEIIDAADKIARLKPAIDEMVKEGLVTIQDVEVILYRPE